MKEKLAHFITHNKIILSIVILFFTVIMLYFATKIEMNYEMMQMLPEDNDFAISYKKFKEKFGVDASTILIATNKKDFYTNKNIQNWQKFNKELSKIKGIDSVISEVNISILEKNDSLELFTLNQISSFNKVYNESEIINIKKKIDNLKSINSSFFNEKRDFHAILLLVNQKFFESKERKNLSNDIIKVCNENQVNFDNDLLISGLPFIRAVNMQMIQQELLKFVLFSIIATLLVILVFYRSLKIILFTFVLVIIGLIFTLGLIGILGFKLSAILGLLPALIIVLAVPNSVYLINHFQRYYLTSNNLELSIKDMIIKIGGVTFITNLTTAIGVGTFIFTNSQMLKQFGIVASISILILFVLSIIIIPLLFSFFGKDMNEKHSRHLEKKWILKFLNYIRYLLINKRKFIILSTILLIMVSILGVYLVETKGKIIDDLPKGNKVRLDLESIQNQIGGIMPMEILISSQNNNKFENPKTINKINEVQNHLKKYDDISNSLSYVNALKYINQVYYNNNPNKFSIPKSIDKIQIKKYIENSDINISTNKYIDSTKKIARISCNVKDIGIDKVNIFLKNASPIIDSILNPDKKEIEYILIDYKTKNRLQKVETINKLVNSFPYLNNSIIYNLKNNNDNKYIEFEKNGIDPEYISKLDVNVIYNSVKNTFLEAEYTGFTINFAKGSEYLIYNLFYTIMLSVLLISIIIFIVHRSFWITYVCIITNIIPLLFTLGMMGFLGIELKPSTILIFSISLGIGIDDAIHFLTKFNHYMIQNNKKVQTSVLSTIHDVGISMFYTSIILVFGFLVFIFSDYGSTQALGLLISISLLIAMICNLLILPGLLIIFQKQIER